MSNKGWIGVDLDGTLAHYDYWRGIEHIGAPIEPMVRRVQQWLAKGETVKIMTARVSPHDRTESEIKATQEYIWAWCVEHIGAVLEVTCCKDFHMVELWDDRVVQVVPNEGVSAVKVLTDMLKRTKP